MISFRLTSMFALLCAARLTAVTFLPVDLPGNTFEDKIDVWPLTDEYAIGPWGRDGGAALKCERTKPQYHFMSRPIRLEHGKSYRLGWWMKIDGTLPGEGAAVSIDWFSHGAWTSFTMLKLIKTTDGEWCHFTGEFTAPANPDFTFCLLAYLRNGTQGTVYFDDFTLEEIVGESNVYPLNVSNGKAVRNEPLDVRVFVSGGLSVPQLDVVWTAEKNIVLKKGIVPVVDGHALLDLHGLPLGTHTLTMKPLAAVKGDFPSFTYPIEVVEENTSRVRIDSLGRCLVDGKPFMPLGWFVAGISRDWSNGRTVHCSLQVMADSPFNVIMPYNGVSLQDTNLKGFEAMKDGLDACRNADIMVICSLKDLYPSNAIHDDYGISKQDVAAKIVNELKDHPAILAWYISDEMPKSMAAELQKRRQLINRLDSNHPTWALFCSYADIPYFGGSFDVIGIDPYPLNSRQDVGILSVAQALQDTRKATLLNNDTMPLWSVPQAFNAAIYSKGKDSMDAETFFKMTRCPTARESLAMAILHAIHGAKGFLFYSDFDLRMPPEDRRYDARWKELCEMGTVLKSLEPFIMSVIPPLVVHVETTKGRVDTAAFRSEDGKTAVLLVAPSRDGGNAIVSGEQLPKGMVSRFGFTTETAPGVYRFNGSAADCDILLQP